MADFGVPSLARIWLLAGVPLMAFIALVIAAAASLRARGRLPAAPFAWPACVRAMALALTLPVFALVPIAFREGHVDLDDGVITALAWLSVLYFACGCVWMARSGLAIPRTEP